MSRQEDDEDGFVRLAAGEVDRAAGLDALHFGLKHVEVALEDDRVLEEPAAGAVRMQRIAAAERDKLEEKPAGVFDLHRLDGMFAVLDADAMVVRSPLDRGASRTGEEKKNE